MPKNDTDVGTGLVGAPACGDVMKLQIRVDPKDNTISDVKFKTFGCGSAIASSSYLTQLVRGMTLEQAGRIKNTEIAKELCLPPVKRKFLKISMSYQFERHGADANSQSIVPCSLKTPSNPPFQTTTQRTPRPDQPTWVALLPHFRKWRSKPFPPPLKIIYLTRIIIVFAACLGRLLRLRNLYLGPWR